VTCASGSFGLPDSGLTASNVYQCCPWIYLVQVQKLKGLLAKQNVSLKALEREKAALASVPAKLEVLCSLVSPGNDPAIDSHTLWCLVRRWDVPIGPVGPAKPAEDGSDGTTGGGAAGDAAPASASTAIARVEWQPLATVLLWASSAACVANKGMVRCPLWRGRSVPLHNPHFAPLTPFHQASPNKAVLSTCECGGTGPCCY
jgi:hypothetical protein